MKGLTRRNCFERIGLASVAGSLAVVGGARLTGADESASLASLTKPELAEINDVVRRFMERFGVPGLSLAVARRGKFLLQAGFGLSDKDAGIAVNPAHLFRIASVSKPLTSVTVFSLIEQGRLGLNDLVFGDQGRIKLEFGKARASAIRNITLHHLLTHTCGGWGNSRNDPMFLHPAMNHQELIEWTLEHQPLTHAPGSNFAYSNFGYCILGRVIESITGLPYARAVQQDVLAKCGVQDMRIAGNTAADRANNEVSYYGAPGGSPYNMNVARMDSHGGWLATASDLVRFAMHVDGFTTTPNILNRASIATMTTPGSANPNYACGWSVNKQPNWWHGGSLPGTSAIMVRTANGLCWAALANARSEGINPALDRMMWQIVGSVPAWRS